MRQRDAERSPEVRAACPLLSEALPWIGHPQNRNRGTIGGSIVHADPAAELPAVAVALDATVELVGTRGSRTVPATTFFEGPFTTAVEPDEVVTGVRFPAAEGVPCRLPGAGAAAGRLRGGRRRRGRALRDRWHVGR